MVPVDGKASLQQAFTDQADQVRRREGGGVRKWGTVGESVVASNKHKHVIYCIHNTV